MSKTTFQALPRKHESTKTKTGFSFVFSRFRGQQDGEIGSRS